MFETFGNKADIGVRGKGASAEEAFCECAKAMISVMASLKTIAPNKRIPIKVSAPDMNALLVNFLNEVLYVKDKNKMVFSKFIVKIRENPQKNGFELNSECLGEEINPKKHELRTDIKAATYSLMKVEKRGIEWIAQCVVDV